MIHNNQKKMINPIKFFGIIFIIISGFITNIGCGIVETMGSIFIIQSLTNLKSGDNNRPSVSKTTPLNNSNNVTSSLEYIDISFNEPMNQNGWSLIDCGGGNVPNFIGTPKFINDKTIRLNVNLEPDTSYEFCVNSDQTVRSNFIDLAGNPAKKYKLKFKTERSNYVKQNNANKAESLDIEVLENLKEMCTNTANIIKNNGIEAVKNMIKLKEKHFIKDNSYVFILDTEGIMIAHPIEPILNDKKIIDVKDINGFKFIDHIIATAQTSGKGVVDYFWPKYGTGDTNPVRKSSYFIKIPETKYIVCAGTNINN